MARSVIISGACVCGCVCVRVCACACVHVWVKTLAMSNHPECLSSKSNSLTAFCCGSSTQTQFLSQRLFTNTDTAPHGHTALHCYAWHARISIDCAISWAQIWPFWKLWSPCPSTACVRLFVCTRALVCVCVRLFQREIVWTYARSLLLFQIVLRLWQKYIYLSLFDYFCAPLPLSSLPSPFRHSRMYLCSLWTCLGLTKIVVVVDT